MRTCLNCGQESNGNEKFCINCGTNLPELHHDHEHNSSQHVPPPGSLENAIQQPHIEEPIQQNNMFQHQENQLSQQGRNGDQPKQICSNCGRVSLKPSRFCLECGTPLQEVPQTQSMNTVNQEQHKRSQPVQPPKEKKPMSRGKKIGIASVIVLIALLIGAHLYIQNMLDPKGQLEKITKHFEDKDEKEFMNSFIFPDDAYVEEKAFYKYIKENDYLLDDLEDAVKEVKKDGKAEVYNSFDEKVIRLREKSYLFFYKKVTFEVLPVDVLANNYWSNQDVSIQIGKHEAVKLSDEKTKVGSYAPGIYDYKITYSDGYFEEEIKDEAIIEASNGNDYFFDIDLSENVVYLTSDIEDAIVYINGKSTDKTASEIELVAAPLDGSVEIYAEAKNEAGETITSETLYLTEYETHLYFAEIQEQYQIQDFYDYYSYDAEDLFYYFRNDYQYAVNTADFSYVSDYFINGSQLKKDYEKFVIDHTDLGLYYYYFISNEVIDIKPLSANSLQLDSLETFEFSSEDDGTWHYEREKRYTIEYIDGELKIANIEDLKEVNKTRVE